MSEQDNNDAEVLFPDRDLILSTGEQVTVREFRFLEGLKIEREARPLIEHLQQAGESGSEHAPIEILEQLLSEHQELLVRLIARACDRESAWLETLSDSDGTVVMLTFWEVNSGFFMRRLQMRLVMREAMKLQAEPASESEKSSQDSSSTDTTGESSDDTRSAS